MVGGWNTAKRPRKHLTQADGEEEEEEEEEEDDSLPGRGDESASAHNAENSLGVITPTTESGQSPNNLVFFRGGQGLG